MIVKYLTSSKLTRLQLRDAAFRRTLLLQCLVLLQACANPIPRKAKPGGGGTKLPVPGLKEKQARPCWRRKRPTLRVCHALTSLY